MIRKFYSLSIILVLSLAYALADTPVVKNRQINQQVRIHQGAKSGELTKTELIQLQKQQTHINRTKKAARADGVVTKKERAQIHHKQNKANANIYRKKHNNVNR